LRQKNVPFSLRQLKASLKALQKQNPADQLSPSSRLWQNLPRARQAAKSRWGGACGLPRGAAEEIAK